MASKVYFTRNLDPESLVKMYKKVGVEQKGKIALKVHSGEIKGPYFLRPEFLKPLYDHTNGTFVECNAAYKEFFAVGGRWTTELHNKTKHDNGWDDYRFCLMDEDPTKDKKLPVEGGEIIKEDLLGEHYDEFDSLCVCAHFKGHPMAGFGGCIKQLSIGMASRAGKARIHTGAFTDDFNITFDADKDGNFVNCAKAADFAKAMGETAAAVHKYYKNKGMGGPVYLLCAKNISLYCDCVGLAQPKPEIHDIGIFAGTDPVAIDRACLDVIKKTTDPGTQKLLDQIKTLCGEEMINQAEKMGAGTTKYELVYDEGDAPQ